MDDRRTGVRGTRAPRRGLRGRLRPEAGISGSGRGPGRSRGAGPGRRLRGGGPGHGHRAVRARGGPAVRARDGGGRLAGHARPAARARRRRRAGQPGLRARGLPQLLTCRAAGRRRVHPACPAPAARLLEGAGPGPDRADAAARRGPAAARPDLRLPPGRDRGGLPGLVRARRDGPRRGIHRRGLRRTHPDRVQHLPLAAGADAGRGRLRDRGPRSTRAASTAPTPASGADPPRPGRPQPAGPHDQDGLIHGRLPA